MLTEVKEHHLQQMREEIKISFVKCKKISTEKLKAGVQLDMMTRDQTNNLLQQEITRQTD